MRQVLPAMLFGVLILSACGGSDTAPVTQRLVVEPDDGRAPMLDAIAGAKDNIRLTIYQISDLQSVQQSPPAPADGIAQALIDQARRGIDVRVVVDQAQYDRGGTSGSVQQTVAALRAAAITVHPSSTAFCVTHQKTFVIDGPTAAHPDLSGTAVIMSLNLTPGYFGGTRDYAVVTREPGVVREASRVFDADFSLGNPGKACGYADSPAATLPPPTASDTPLLAEAALLWSPVNSKSGLTGLIDGARNSLALTTEELTDADMVCRIQALAQSPAKPSIRILLSGDTGSNASAVKTLLALGLPNLAIRVMPGQPQPGQNATRVTPLYMHGKQVIADGTRAFIGSENLTNTSLIQNRELGIVFTDPAMIGRLQDVFTRDFTSAVDSLAAQPCTSGPGCETITCPTTH